MKTAKQDRQGASTPAGYNRSFAEIMGVALDAQKSVKDGNKLIASINAAAEVIRVTANRFELTSDNLSISADGRIVAQNANIAGEITATSGIIGGCRIENGVLNIDGIEANNIKISGDIVGNGIKSTNGEDTTLIAGGVVKFGGSGSYALYAPRSDVDGAFLGVYASGTWTTLYLDKETGCVKYK